MVKKTLIGIGIVAFLLSGCSDKFSPERKSVVTIMQHNMGTTQIVGWKNYKTDSDKDGVPDYLDKCPNTPLGVKVDKKGCPLDNDKDGVPNYLDKCPNTPLGTKVNHEGCPILAQFKFNFKFDSYKINKKYYPEIAKLAKLLKKTKGIKKIEIQGYTDNIGGYLYNKDLSIKRANALRIILINKYKIKPSRISIIGFGTEYPIATNTTAQGRAKNRRVTVIDATSFTKQPK